MILGELIGQLLWQTDRIGVAFVGAMIAQVVGGVALWRIVARLSRRGD